MSSPHPIALLGFSELEYSTFESLFRLAARRPPGYQIVAEPGAARLILANADDAAVMDQLRRQPPKAGVLLIGQSDGGTGWGVSERPIKLMSVLTALDQLIAPPVAAAPAPAVGVPSRPAPLVVPVPTSAPELPADAAPGEESVLVVDDSDTALRFMQRLLRRIGYRAELVRSGEQALLQLRRHHYRFIFLDVVMQGMDGYQVCRIIKGGSYPGERPPVVVMMTSQDGTLDKIKGRMAGCDAYLIKPLGEDDLLRVFARHDTTARRAS